MAIESFQNFSSPELRTAFSSDRDEWRAVEQLYQQLNWTELNFVLFFCSAEYDLEKLADAMQTQLQDVLVAGCITAGEITPEGYAQGCISAVGFSRAAFAVSGALIN